MPPRLPALPILDVLPDVRARLGEASRLILKAAPGAGKTTLVPLALLDEAWLAGRRIVMLEPRRLAARAAAARMAELLGEEVGDTVGYRVRLDARVSARTRIEVVTEGILTRRLHDDPALDGVALVIFDEFHERHLHTDLAAALCLDAQALLRPDLKLLVMSATLDVAPLTHLLDGAPVIESRGRAFEVALRYLPEPAARDVVPALVAAVRCALADETGDILAFLPGAGEIRRAQASLGVSLPAGVVLHALYGDLPKAEQDRAIRPDPDGRRKLVLATPIAESSLTIDGVRVVIDSGLRRAPRFDARSGLTRLVTVRIAKDAADQRSGRAGRTQAGVCYRLYSPGTYAGMAARTTPEILSSDLAELTLALAAWGTPPSQLRWLDLPPPAHLAQARDTLETLGALDAHGAVTALGRRLAALPVHPRLACMLLAARARDLAALACDLAALLSERDVLRECGSPDLSLRVEALLALRAGRAPAAADAGALRAVERVAQSLRRMLGADPATSADPYEIGLLTAFAYPDRIAQRRAARDPRLLLANGRGAALAGAAAFGEAALLVAVELDAGQGEARVYLAAPLLPADLAAHFADRVVERARVEWDAKREAVSAARERRYGEIVLETKPLPAPPPEAWANAWREGLRRLGPDALPWSAAARAFQARVAFARRLFPDAGWPDLSDAALMATADAWLLPQLANIGGRAQLAALDLAALLTQRLDWRLRKRLDEIAPAQLTLKRGTRAPLDYTQGESPVLAIKLQALFGVADTPRVAEGRVPVTLHLLSPARRPIQVTQDLRGFWARTYAEVKKELKGRYPKHAWPETPQDDEAE